MTFFFKKINFFLSNSKNDNPYVKYIDKCKVDKRKYFLFFDNYQVLLKKDYNN